MVSSTNQSDDYKKTTTLEGKSNGFFALSEAWKCQFNQSLFIPENASAVGEGGIIKVSDGVCLVPGWCGGGSIFTYDPKEDVWNEIALEHK